MDKKIYWLNKKKTIKIKIFFWPKYYKMLVFSLFYSSSLYCIYLHSTILVKLNLKVSCLKTINTSFKQWIIVYSNKRFDYDIIRYTMTWTVNNATMDYDNSKVEFMVVDVKRWYKEKPRVIHNYVKNIKISRHQN